MKFRTQIDISPLAERIDYSHKILAVGSCFADVVGARLRRAKFRVDVNPSGVLFNPASISMALDRFINKRYVSLDELHHGAQGWSHYDFHSSLSRMDAEECVESINHAIDMGHQAVMGADWIILTLGTSWVYRLIGSGKIVASCHKQPSSMFVRERLSVDQIVEELERCLGRFLESKNSKDSKNIILTLSPIRHIADGLPENSLSKATLRVAIDEFMRWHPQRVNYFPSYEIFMDDLRDYRFYGDDMVHPSSVGVDYVWEQFCGVAISKSANDLMSKILNIIRASEHRPYNPESDAHKQFCRAQLCAISSLEYRVNMDAERLYFEKWAE
ncbi:MAG: GSCFA domain-containing protein [Rikenellaceae bacterium]